MSSNSTSSPATSSTSLLSLNDAYRILEITTTANTEEIKSAYKRQALKSHPDKNPNDPFAHQKFVKISEAYKQLSDPKRCIEEDDDDEDDAEEDDEGEDDDHEIDEERDHDHDHGFAFRMFEKMCFGKHGNKIKGRKISGGLMFSSRHECDCPHCRCYSKPKSPYIPKSQRPKDPNIILPSPSHNSSSTTPIEQMSPSAIDDWLDDLDEQKKNNSKKQKSSGKKKSTPKKKSSKDSQTPHQEPSQEHDNITMTDHDREPIKTEKHEIKKTKKENKSNTTPTPVTTTTTATAGSKGTTTAVAAAAAAATRNHQGNTNQEEEEVDEDDDAITAEDMATTLGFGKHLRKESVPSVMNATEMRAENKGSKTDKNMKSKIVENNETSSKSSKNSQVEKGKDETIPTTTTTSTATNTTTTTTNTTNTTQAGEKKNMEKTTKSKDVKDTPTTKKSTGNEIKPTLVTPKPTRPIVESQSTTNKNNNRSASKSTKETTSGTYFYAKQLKILLEMGFPEDASRVALDKASGGLDLATSFLLQQTPEQEILPTSPIEEKKESINDTLPQPPPPPTPVPVPVVVPISPPVVPEKSSNEIPIPPQNPSNSSSSSSSYPLASLSDLRLDSTPHRGTLDSHHDLDFDDLLLVPSSYESFTSQLQEQIDLEAKNSMAWCVPCPVGEKRSSFPRPSSHTSSSSSSSVLNSSLLPMSFLTPSDSQLSQDLFPSLGQIFTTEPPTLQLFPQTPQLFQTDLFLGSSPSASSTVSSISLVSGDTIDDHPIHLPENTQQNSTISSTIKQTVSSTPASNSTSKPSSSSSIAAVAPKTVAATTSTTNTNTTSSSSSSTTTKTPSTTTSSSSSSSLSTSSSSTITPAASKPACATLCMYYNTPRGCRNSNTCKFLHLENDKNKESSSSSSSSSSHHPHHSLPSSSTSSSSSTSRPRPSNPTRHIAKVCAFFPTPAGCKLGNSCKFTH